jgi:hypothetical protein
MTSFSGGDIYVSIFGTREDLIIAYLAELLGMGVCTEDVLQVVHPCSP